MNCPGESQVGKPGTQAAAANSPSPRIYSRPHFRPPEMESSHVCNPIPRPSRNGKVQHERCIGDVGHPPPAFARKQASQAADGEQADESESVIASGVISIDPGTWWAVQLQLDGQETETRKLLGARERQAGRTSDMPVTKCDGPKPGRR